MREILFRGKRLLTGEWVYGYYIHQTLFYGDDVDRHWIMEEGEFDSDYYEAKAIKPETLGQFTGLVDVNGKKIFEGDILDSPKYIVTYCADVNESCGMSAGWYVQRNDFEGWLRLENRENHIILGNEFDNPELMGK